MVVCRILKGILKLEVQLLQVGIWERGVYVNIILNFINAIVVINIFK